MRNRGNESNRPLTKALKKKATEPRWKQHAYIIEMAALLALYASSVAAPTQPTLSMTVAEQVVLTTPAPEVMEFDVRAMDGVGRRCCACCRTRRLLARVVLLRQPPTESVCVRAAGLGPHVRARLRRRGARASAAGLRRHFGDDPAAQRGGRRGRAQLSPRCQPVLRHDVRGVGRVRAQPDPVPGQAGIRAQRR
jgi:hypothetical protein